MCVRVCVCVCAAAGQKMPPSNNRAWYDLPGKFRSSLATPKRLIMHIQAEKISCLQSHARARTHTLKRSLVLSPCCAVNASSQPRSGVVNRLTTVSNPQFPMAPVLWPAHFLFTTRLSVRPFFVSPVRSPRPSVRPSVRSSFHRSVRPSVLRFPVPLCSSVARPFFPGPPFVRLGSPSRSLPSTRGRRG